MAETETGRLPVGNEAAGGRGCDNACLLKEEGGRVKVMNVDG